MCAEYGWWSLWMVWVKMLVILTVNNIRCCFLSGQISLKQKNRLKTSLIFNCLDLLLRFVIPLDRRRALCFLLILLLFRRILCSSHLFLFISSRNPLDLFLLKIWIRENAWVVFTSWHSINAYNLFSFLLSMTFNPSQAIIIFES